MASNSEGKAILLAQRWGAGKLPIGSEFVIKDTNRTMTLVECDGYPHGKFIFDDGEEFNIGKYFDTFFVEITKDHVQDTSTSVYDEDLWNKVDNAANEKKNNGEDLDNSSIRKTTVQEQKNESFRDFAYFDVTEIIDLLLKDKNKYRNDELKELYKSINTNNYPFFTKEKLSVLFSICEYKETSQQGIYKIVIDDTEVGFLANESGKYFFAPKNKKLGDEYSFESDTSIGFFYTADSYLDIALSTIERYRKVFLPLYHADNEKNKESLGYQSDATIKTLLAFSCECYLKSILLNNGKNISEIKNLGHGLSSLFTSLDDNSIGYIYGYMERNGYNLGNSLYQRTYETNDLTEKFKLDLARVDDAFVDSRYNAEKDKNTNYSFLYQFALALRKCSEKNYYLISPFTESIDQQVSKNK